MLTGQAAKSIESRLKREEQEQQVQAELDEKKRRSQARDGVVGDCWQ
jgi:hypothetical protein